MREPANTPLLPHSLELTGRKKAAIHGVQAVDSFNEQMVALATSEGALTLLGSGLHVSHLHLEEGQLLVEGDIDALEYDSAARPRGSWLSRLTR
ncbi:MAG: sporulation protein [Clostridia bacterium]|nr:sporulation protein [Clostridia bacterium]